MTNWDTLSKPKKDGGIGVRKFGLMNKALLAKQQWRICKNPNLLLTKTLKAKYSPQVDLHLHKPKNHSSWIWKSIMNQPTPLLTQGTQKVGRGFDIPINHPHWFPFKPDAHAHVVAQITKVADLINQDNATWKHDVIMQLYDKTNAIKILEIALPKIQPHASSDLIIWPCSPTCEYQVKRAYTLLHHFSPFLDS